MASERLKTLPAEGSPNNRHLLAWSPDGQRIAFGSSPSEVAIVDVDSGDIVLTFDTRPKHDSHLTTLAWSPDGKHIATGTWHGEVKVWNADNGDCTGTLYDPKQQSNLGAMTWHHDSRRLAVGLRYGWTHVYDAIEAKLLWAGKAPNNTGGESMAWSPNGELLAAGHGGVVLYSAEGKRLHYFDCHRGSTHSLIWLDDRRIVSGGTDQNIVILDVETKAETRRLTHHAAGVDQVIWDDQAERLISASTDGRIKIAALDRESSPFRVLKHTEHEVQCLAFSPDDQLLAAGYDRDAGVWRIDKSELLAEFEGSKHEWYSGRFFDLKWRPDGKVLAGACKASPPIVWNRETRIAKFPEKQFDFLPRRLDWSPDGKLLALGGDNRSQLWDGDTYEVLHEFEETGSLHWHLDSNRLHIGSVVVDPITGKVVARQQPDVGEISPNEKLAARVTNIYSGKDAIAIYSMIDGQELLQLKGHNGSITQSAWSPDGRRIGTASRDGTVKIWDAATGDLLITLPHPAGEAYVSLTWSHDGRILAAGSTNGETHLYGSAAMPDVPKADHVETGRLASVKTHEEQLADLRQKIAVDPENFRARRETIDLLERLQRWEEALVAIHQYLELSPGDSWRPTRGLLMAQLADKAERVEAYTRRCEQLIQDEALKDYVRSHAVMALALSPALAVDPEFLVERSRPTAESSTSWYQQLPLLLALLRSEQYEELEQRLKPLDQDASYERQTVATLLRTIRQFRDGQTQTAIQSMKAARGLLDTLDTDVSGLPQRPDCCFTAASRGGAIAAVTYWRFPNGYAG